MSDNNGSAGAGNPAPGAGDGGGTGGAWFDSIPDAELKGFAQTKGWKDPASVVDGYRNLEKLIGAPKERVLKLPEKPDDPGWGEVWGKLGRPDKPEAYELPIPEGHGDPEFAKGIAEVMHKHGVPKGAAHALAEFNNNYVKNLIETHQREQQQKSAAELSQLKSEWGAKFNENAELSKRAAREFGVSAEQAQALEGALGTAGMLKLFNSIGSRLAEPKPFEAGGSGDGGSGFGLTPEAAKARIGQLRNDRDWAAKYLAGDVHARQEMERLTRVAAGG
jgi:hypothetical protein